MSQQGLDLKKSIHIVRRHKIIVGVAVALGLLVGASYAVVNPPTRSSSVLLVLPSLSAANMATEVVIAGSDPVLSGAVNDIGSGVTLQTLSNDVKVSSETSSIIQVTASSKNGELAEKIANGVANSYLAYVGGATSPVGHVRAKILQGATAAAGTTLVKQALVYALIGLAAGALIGFIIALAIGRNDKRLRERDQIANSIGVPVLASIPVEHPADALAWTKLLEEYEPSAVHGWRLRRALQQLGITEALSGAGDGTGMTLGVLSLPSDRGALSLGPHVAAYAASMGIPTALVVGPRQDPDAIAALRTACAAPLSSSSKRGKYLRTIVSEDDGGIGGDLDVALVVAVRIVDSQTPQMLGLPPTAATVLAVSAGTATAEQLARAATIAAEDGRDIAGILVADPDPVDETTGRIPQLGLPSRRSTPTRVQGIPTESRR
jgi:capsular polysaccharide biosynthesis protein